MKAIPYGGRTELSKAAVQRRRDAWVLLAAHRWRGAMYLAGYAVECKLKVQLMERYNCFDLNRLEDKIEAVTGRRPNLATVRGHNLEYLMGFSGSWERLRQNRDVYRCFVVCNTWDHRWRYRGDLGKQQEARRFMECVDRLYDWLSHNV